MSSLKNKHFTKLNFNLPSSNLVLKILGVKYLTNRHFVLWSEDWIFIVEICTSSPIIIKPNRKIKHLLLHIGEIYFTDLSGGIYRLKSSYVDQILSGSSDSQMSGNDQEFEVQYVLNVTSLLFIESLLCGLLILKYDRHHIFIELYQQASETKDFGNICSKSLTFASSQVSEGINILVKGEKKCFDPKLFAVLAGGVYLANVEIVFIGLQNGCVYCFSKFENCQELSNLRLIFSSQYPILGITFLSDEPEGLYRYVAISLGNGTLICLSVKDHLIYEVAYLPTTGLACYALGCDLFVSDHVDLWICQLTKKENQELKIISSLLDIKGVNSYCSGINQSIFVTTVHGSLYQIDVSLSEKQLSDVTINRPLRCKPHADSISDMLTKIELIKHEVAMEDNYITAINTMMVLKTVNHPFKMSVTTFDFLTHTQLSDLSEEFQRKSLYKFEIKIENCSYIEFLPSLWHLLVIIKDKTIFYKKKVDLASSFKHNSILNAVIKANVTDVKDNVGVMCFLICEFPINNDCRNSKIKLSSPFLSVLVGSTVLQSTYFATPITSYDLVRSIERKYSEFDIYSMFFKSNLNCAIPKANQINKGKLLTNTLRLTGDVNDKNLWQQVFKNSLQKLDTVNMWLEKNHENSTFERKIYIFVGFDLVNIIISPGVFLNLTSSSADALYAVKEALIAAQDSRQSAKVIVESSLLTSTQTIKWSLSLQKDGVNRSTLESLKNELRTAITSRFPV